MKFSVLLPTRNRLQYLKYAVETVLRQDYDEWELIISDNFSDEDIAGYVQSIGDSRIKYYRTDSFVSVTDNWNNALEKSSGDYVIMLGDDDCLMKGYFTTMNRLIEQFAAPDFIYTSAFLYAYPGVMPGFSEGYLEEAGCADFLESAMEPFWLNKHYTFELVKQSMNFQLPFDYNMQYATVSRAFIGTLREKGKFFQSPFPDYYAMNVMFIKAERILVCPRPLVTIGITPKSYGFFHFNKREAEGMEFLKSLPSPVNVRRLKRLLLPGTNINNGWLLAMEAIKANYGSEYTLHVNYQHYRLLQIIFVYENYYMNKSFSKEDLRHIKRLMPSWEKLAFTLIKVIPQRKRDRLVAKLKSRLRQYPYRNRVRIEQRYRNILEVFEQINPSHNLSVVHD